MASSRESDVYPILEYPIKAAESNCITPLREVYGVHYDCRSVMSMSLLTAWWSAVFSFWFSLNVRIYVPEYSILPVSCAELF